MSFLHHPWGLVAALVYTYLLVVIHFLGSRRPGLSVLWSAKASLAAALPLLVLMVIFGLFPQSGMNGKWYFILVLLLFTSVLGLAAVDGIARMAESGFSWRLAGKTLSHLAMFLVLAGGLFGSGDTRHVVVSATEGTTVSTGIDEDSGEMVPMPFELTLDKFTFERKGNRPYFLSEVTFTEKGKAPWKEDILVNHPAKVGSWILYQYDYGKSEDGRNTSIFECVSDPWAGFIRVALWLMMVSAAAMIVLAVARRPGKRTAAPAAQPSRTAQAAQEGQAGTASTAAAQSQETPAARTAQAFQANQAAEGTAADADAQEPASAKEKEGRA